MAELNYGETMEEAIVNCLAANGGKLDRSTLRVKIGSRYGRDALKSLGSLGLVESASKAQSFAITKRWQRTAGITRPSSYGLRGTTHEEWVGGSEAAEQ